MDKRRKIGYNIYDLDISSGTWEKGMTINELYQKVGGDYNGVLKRIPAPALIVKYLLRFVECEDYPKCLKAFADADYELDPCRRYLYRKFVWYEERYENLFLIKSAFRGFFMRRTDSCGNS